MNIWSKKSEEEIKEKVFSALKRNINYLDANILGVPGSYLDEKVFFHNASFLKDAPFLSTMLHNPNHIGCHTTGASESFFAGTHEIERELIEICAVDILKGAPNSIDGYVASGGTEANMQAIWIYRNQFMKEFGAQREEMVIITSQDNHYSMDKAGNVLAIDVAKVAVDENNRAIDQEKIQDCITAQKAKGKKYFIIVANMMTTMFGSVDSVDDYVAVLKANEVQYRIHIDGAYGGFYFPFSEENFQMGFNHPEISSVTLDAHKMAQAPYGTGIFLARKGLMQYATTMEASYVEGEDCTLIGSRSGANAISVWMILSKYGPYGWYEKIYILQKRTEWFCEQLAAMGVEYFRHPKSNLVTMRAKHLNEEIAQKYGLVPDNHHEAKWFKVVIMEHVTVERLMPLVEDLKVFNA
ncbi:pyridoxal phosphate-dependent decarboxylase family protein [Persicobacter diffluens]|uniref:Cytochrome d ubiquinol oxidase subunit I n=1 Tax=Persicobacter diffluens TaxID=981 RepID=A0AAN5AN89_9BACT|nr:cytochrome d ubiquinol oxidase subunit I [Persicobacter diffluens]